MRRMNCKKMGTLAGLAIAITLSACAQEQAADETAAAAAAGVPAPPERDPSQPGSTLFSTADDQGIDETENFTGEAKVMGRHDLAGDDAIKGVSVVSFGPGGRTKWHTHPYGQLIVVTEGTGWVQAQGEDTVEVSAGEFVWSAPGVTHWHGGTETTGMTALAISQRYDEYPVVWADDVAEEHYHGPDGSHTPPAE